MTSKPPPSALVATRPAVELDPEHVHNPAQGPCIGDPPKRYTPGVHAHIVQLIEQGNRPHIAASIAGIPASTHYEWMRRGRENDPHLWQYAEDVERAMAVAEGTAVASITSGAFEDRDDAKWWLERVRADGYSKEANTKVNSMLEEFFKRLESALPPQIFQMVIAAASGQALASEKATFQLTSAEEDSQEVEQ